MRFALLLACWALCLPGLAHATTYYVSPTGSDRAAGNAPAHAWRSVGRVDRAALSAGDRVLFAAGARFAGTLSPPASSTSYGSFGPGRARIVSSRGAVWLPPGASHVTFTDLDLSSTPNGTSVFAGSARGSGNVDVTLTRSVLHDSPGSAVLQGNVADRDWHISRNWIRHVGDSGIIFAGSRIGVEHNRIVDTGFNRAITWGKHGIYAKGPDARIVGNTIRGYRGDGISLRYHGATVIGNAVGPGGIAIAWFQNDRGKGTTTIERNRLSGSRYSSIYISPSDSAGRTRESFVIRSNTIRTAAGNAFDIERTSGSVTITGNRVAGRHDLSLMLVRPLGRLLEGANAWSRSGASPTFRVGGSFFPTLGGYRSATGLGAGDVVAS